MASFVAPTTFVTALLFYFGFAYTDALYEQFGVDAATLGFSSQDYLLRSASPLFIPGFIALATGLLLILAYYLAGAVADRDPDDRLRTGVRYGSYGLVVVGAGLFVLGMLAGFSVWRTRRSSPRCCSAADCYSPTAAGCSRCAAPGLGSRCAGSRGHSRSWSPWWC